MTSEAETTVSGRTRFCQTVKEMSLELWQGGIFYVLLSFALLMLMNHCSGFINQHIDSVFFENLAPGSITLLFSFGAIISAAIMLIFGPYNDQKKCNDLIYRYTVFPLVNTGKALTITGAGMMGGLFLACLVSGESKDSMIALLFFAMFLFYQLAFHLMQHFVKRGFNAKISERKAKCILATIIVIIPCLYIWAIYPK